MRVAVGLLTCVLAIAVLGTATVGAVDTAADDVEPDAIFIDVRFSGDDRAVWTIEHRYLLEDDAAEAAFEELEADIEDHPDEYRDRFADRMESTTEMAAMATGRSMAVDDVAVETETRSLPRSYGIIRYSFTWHGFAVVEEDTLVAGDAITGLFLDESTSIRFSWSDEFGLASVTPTPDDMDDRSLIWRGPHEFTSDEPHVELHRQDADRAVPGMIGGPAVVVVFALMVALVGVGVAGWRYRSTSAPPDEPNEPTALLSNEEQVLRLLAEHDGRMKQQDVVQQLGWTDAKTSQVVSELREAGEIESFRLGRENVLSIAEEDGTDA